VVIFVQGDATRRRHAPANQFSDVTWKENASLLGVHAALLCILMAIASRQQKVACSCIEGRYEQPSSMHDSTMTAPRRLKQHD
jgi:hypothetical protein